MIKLDKITTCDIVLAMNDYRTVIKPDVSEYQLEQFQELITKLFQCCQERMQYQCERFQLPDAEFRCLGLFGQERYLTAKGIALKMNVVKSRVSKIIDGLIKKKSMDFIYNEINSENKRKIWLKKTDHPILDSPDHNQVLSELIKYVDSITT